MDTFYSLENREKKLGVYVGYDPNLKYQECIILNENDDNFKVKFVNVYIGQLEVNLNKKDVFLT